MRKRPVCIYVDNSNIYIGGQEVAKHFHEDPAQLRLAFENFLALITQGQEFDELVWAGSGPPELEEIFKNIVARGVELLLIPRSATGENETVDQALQLAMYRHHRKYRNRPGTIVLCTGDGKGFHEEKGFLWDVQGFIEDGWTLDLYSWDSACHNGLKRFAKKHGKYVPLEDYYASITFQKNGRHVVPLNKARRKAPPAPPRKTAAQKRTKVAPVVKKTTRKENPPAPTRPRRTSTAGRMRPGL